MLPVASVLALLLAVLAVVLGVLLARARRALAAASVEAAGLRAEVAAGRDELATTTTALDDARARVEAVEAERDAARRERADAEAAGRRAAQAQAAAEAEVSETAALAARLIDDGAADPAALWALERARSERTWRHSVAAVADAGSPFVGAPPLPVALEIEAAAVREEVGAVVDLTVDLPAGTTAGASLATLRVTQELLALAARKGEVTTVAVGAEGTDIVVRVAAFDAESTPLAPDVLALPPSRIEIADGVARLRDALAPLPASR